MTKMTSRVLVPVFLMLAMSLAIAGTASAAVCPGGPGPTCIELRVENPPSATNTPTFSDGATVQTWPTPGVPGCLPDVTPNWPGPLVTVNTTAPVAPPIQLCYTGTLDENRPVVCSGAVPSLMTLWSPNHQLVPINVLAVTDPDGDPVAITITGIRQDEHVNALGDGSTGPDGVGVGSSTAFVRAERAGGGNGRVYHIAFIADDGNGGTCNGEVLVSVPKSQGAKGAAVDGGALYDSTAP